MHFLCSTSSLTSSSAWCKAMCDANLCKLTSSVSDPVKKLMVVESAKFAACYGIRDFITDLRAASRWMDTVLSQKNPLHVLQRYLFSIHFAAQTVLHLLLTAEIRIRPWASPFGICGGQSGRLLRFSPYHYHSI